MLNAPPGKPQFSLERAWEYWCHRAGVPFRAQI
jgi:hypothetical protein